MNESQKPKVLSFSGDNTFVSKVNHMADNSIRVTIDIGEQDDSIMAALYGFKKRGIGELIISSEPLSTDDSDEFEDLEPLSREVDDETELF